jgi:hypothetical protein
MDTAHHEFRTDYNTDAGSRLILVDQSYLIIVSIMVLVFD